ncbi:MAG: hypothetical protein Q4C42_02385 [Clostridia bacterium]|nr:hypothetical protein [Clostridia bacterium]
MNSKNILKKKDGAAMVLAICIMSIFMVLCLSLFLSSSMLMKRATALGNREQCRVSSVSVSKELEYNLVDGGDGIYKYVTDTIKNNALGYSVGWPYLDENEYGHRSTEATREFEMTEPEDFIKNSGEITLKLYWEYSGGRTLNDIILHVDVTAEKSGEKHMVRSMYKLTAYGDNLSWKLSERR